PPSPPAERPISGKVPQPAPLPCPPPLPPRQQLRRLSAQNHYHQNLAQKALEKANHQQQPPPPPPSPRLLAETKRPLTPQQPQHPQRPPPSKSPTTIKAVSSLWMI